MSPHTQCFIVVELSYVDARPSQEAILKSKKPVCYSDYPAGRREQKHLCIKNAEELRLISSHCAFISVTMFPSFLKRGTDETVDDYAEAIDCVISLVGEDCIGVGTDCTQGTGQKCF